jgi:predicted nuclease of predicted toxin-antitoxin system
MKILSDANVPQRLSNALRAEGHDVYAACERMPQSSDAEILNRAQAERRIILTFDKDFGELAFRAHLPAKSGVILVRLEIVAHEMIVKRVLEVMNSRDDWSGNFTTITDRRVRQRELPDR